MTLKGLPWQHKISNAAQIGGIETSVLDNGAGRGTRIAWVNTGEGLRYKVVIDRAMDIADAFYNQYSLAWLNNPALCRGNRFRTWVLTGCALWRRVGYYMWFKPCGRPGRR